MFFDLNLISHDPDSVPTKALSAPNMSSSGSHDNLSVEALTLPCLDVNETFTGARVSPADRDQRPAGAEASHFELFIHAQVTLPTPMAG